MKKILLFASALAGLFLAGSCQRENLEPMESANTVTYTVQVPGALSTKAIGENVSAVTELVYEVYRTEATSKDDFTQAEALLFHKTAEITDGTATVEFELVNDQNFRVLFWAQVPENGVYNVKSLKNVTISQALNANAENYAAFAGADYIKAGESIVGRTLPLVRPIAQLNIGTDDASLWIENQTKALISTSAVKVNGLSTSYNVAEDKAGEISADDYVYAAKPVAPTTEYPGLSESTFAVNGTNYNYVAMNYVGFAPQMGTNVKVTYTINTENVGTIENTIDNVPVKANHRTNIVGNLITSMSDYTVTLDNKWPKEEINVEVVSVSTAADLQDAIENIQTGTEGNIKLEGNIDLGALFGASTLSVTKAGNAQLPIVIPEGKTMTLDLNGFTITTPWEDETAQKHYYAFENHGTLNIVDSKVKGQIVARGNFNYGKMTLESGTITACDGNGGYGVRNYEGAEFVMNGGSIVTSNEDDHQVDKGGYDATTLRVDEGATATINGGTINNICDFTFALDNYGTTTVKGGEFTSIHTTAANYGTLTIDGGSFTINGLDGVTAHALWADAGTTTINGGTFDGKDNYNGFNVNASAGAVVNITGGKFLPVHSGSLYGEGTINVTGGEFFDDPSARLVNGYEAVQGEYGYYTIQYLPEAKIGETIYSTLTEAFNVGGNIELLHDVTLSNSIVVDDDKNITLDLGNHTITGPDAARDSEGNKIHVLKNNGTLIINNGTISSIAINGGSAILNKGTLTLNNVTVNGAPSDTATGTASYAVNTEGAGSKLTVNNSNISGRGAIGATEGTKVELNGGTYHTPAVAWGHAVYATNEGTEVVINDGIFSEGYEMAANNWGMYQIYSGDKAKVTVKGGTFKPWDCANGYDLCTASEGVIEICGGTFAEDPSNQNKKNYVAEGYVVLSIKENYTVISTTLKDGAVLDLAGAEYNGTITVEGNVTIKGDTKIKTIKSTTGCTITIEDGKTLTLTNFSFGSKDNANAEYEIKGGTVTANYGFFQHGKYALYSNFETGYMYYSYGSDITVYGTFHSQGKGDGLDYVRGKLTIAKGGKSIHDKSLWVGQPASWGAMEASLTIEDGGYVQANSLSVYEGSSLTYSNDADLKYNSVTGTEYITKK